MSECQLRTQPVHLTTPVTALAYHDHEILLSGQGPYLKVMRISTSETLSCIHLGGDWKVHRIVLANIQRISDTTESRLFLAFGAKSLRVMRLTVTRPGGKAQPTAYFQHLWNVPHMKDWILDVQWLWAQSDLPGEYPCVRSGLQSAISAPPTSIAVGYAHNFVEIYELPQNPFDIPHQENDLLQQDSLGGFRLLYSIRSQENCTLFCGRFHNNTLQDLWFASGTVFCQALLWKVHHEGFTEAPVETSLVGHEGILFGIRWSEDGKAVCTVSDDRTIRVWDIRNPSKITHSTHFGHTARVWDCQIVGQYLVSVSEDASCRVWRNPLLTNLNDVDDMSDCLACWEGHEGKSAWSVAISSHGVVATGGGDGGIHLWRLDSIIDGTTDADQNTRDIDLPDISTYYPDAPANEKEFIRDYVITSRTQSVYGTHTGYILARNDDNNTWRTLHNSSLLKNYVSLEASPCGRVVVAGSLTGNLIIVSVQGEFPPLLMDTLGGIKVQFVFVLNGTGTDDFVIVVFRANCTVGVFRLKVSTATSEATCKHVCDLRLPKNNKAVHAACFTSQYNLAMLGTRDGTVLVYNLDSIAGSTKGPTILDNIIQLERCHGNDSVSSILVLTEPGEGYEGKDRINVYTTGRDGSWAKYRFLGLPGSEVVGARSDSNNGEDLDDEYGSEGEDDTVEASGVESDQNGTRGSTPDLRESGTEIVLQKIFRSKITKGWLEQIFIMDGELLLLGFFNKKLFVYNESKHFEIFSMHSGAANRRRWRFLTNNARLEHTRLMFYSGYKLCSFSRELTAGSELFQSAKLQNNFHGREVRQLRFLTNAQPLADGAPRPIIVASGGEDCRLRMFQYIPYKTKNSCTALRPLCNLKPHLGAAIRCMEWSNTDTPHMYLLFTGGAIESMRAWQVTLSIPNSYRVETIEDHTGKQVPEHTPLSLGCFELAQCPHASENLETRIMDFSVFRIEASPRKHFIMTVYSDSTIRVWLFDEETNSFVLAIEKDHHNKCILQVSHVRQDEGIVMFTAATDGKIAIWDITSALDTFLIKYAAVDVKPVQPHSPSSGKNRRKVRRDYVQGLGDPIGEVLAHMSGVNSLHTQNLGEEGILVVSGGDDNALAVALVKADWDSEHRVIRLKSANIIAKDKDAHSSAIQAVTMMNASEIVTTSQDQMVSLWRLHRSGTGEAGIVKLESQFVHVPDPSTMDIITHGARCSVAIAGIGVQIFDIQTKS